MMKHRQDKRNASKESKRKSSPDDYTDKVKTRKVSKHKTANTVANSEMFRPQPTSHVSTVSDNENPKKYHGIMKNDKVLSQRNRKSTLDKLSSGDHDNNNLGSSSLVNIITPGVFDDHGRVTSGGRKVHI